VHWTADFSPLLNLDDERTFATLDTNSMDYNIDPCSIYKGMALITLSMNTLLSLQSIPAALRKSQIYQKKHIIASALWVSWDQLTDPAL